MVLISMFPEKDKWVSSSIQTIKYFEQKISQSELEDLQIKTFKISLDENYPHLSFDSYIKGDDPPDFYINRDGINIGLEVTSYRNESETSKAEMFNRFKDIFRQEYRKGRLRNIEGFSLDVILSDDVFMNTSKFKSSLLQVIDALNGFRIDPNRFYYHQAFMHEIMNGKRSSRYFPFDTDITSTDGAIKLEFSGYTTDINFWISAAQGDDGMFLKECRFHIVMQLGSGSSFEMVEAKLNEIVAKKDKPNNQELLIVAGGPTASGIGNGLDAVTAEHFVLRWAGKIQKPQYLKNVFLLIYPREKVYRLEVLT